MERILTAKEVATQLGIGLPTLYAHVRNGVIAHYRVVDRIVFTQQQVDEFVASCLRVAKE
jgi:excisionase family DNA binding protein